MYIEIGVQNLLYLNNINVEFIRTHLKNYNDIIICELLEFGAPIGFEGKLNGPIIAPYGTSFFK
jgi:hypothetical protein